MEIEKIVTKLVKLDRKLAGIKKAGDQAKSWAAIGQQYGVDVHLNPCNVKEQMRKAGV